MFYLEWLLDEQPSKIELHSVKHLHSVLQANKHNPLQKYSLDLSKESQVTEEHTTRHRPLRGISCKIHALKPWLSALFWYLSFVSIKSWSAGIACFSEYHDNDYSLMLTQDARSDDHALRTPSSEECMRPTKLGVGTDGHCHYWS
jgi:hypothetical protein